MSAIYLEIFVKFAYDLMCEVCLQLMRQFYHSVSGNKNLVPFHLWLREAMTKGKNVTTYFAKGCLEKYFCEL